ncbi:serine hydrolase [Clostridium paraputrificum]|uniref:serine hydrolase n=1 Tax=Clostridium paraputrificum TaxID=29363 RepID=UPI00325ABC60
MKKKKLLLLLGTIALGMILLIGVGEYKMHKAKLEKSAIELEEQQAQREAEREEQEKLRLEEQKKLEEEKKRLKEEEKKKEEEKDKLENNTVANELNKKTSTNNNSLAGLDRIERAKQVAKDYIGSKNASVYYIDLTSGKSFGINENKIYYSASTGKLPAILYTQKKLNEGLVDTGKTFEYQDFVNDIPGAMIRGGTGILQKEVKPGDKIDVIKLLKYTCSYSDNLASNMLGYYVCDKNDGEFKNYTSNVIERKINTFAKEFSAKETALLMRGIYNQGGQAISSLQKTSWDKVKIPKYIPVKVAHKIGINGAYNHDVAVVYANKPYIISIMTKGCSDEFISQLSKKVYDQLIN